MIQTHGYAAPDKSTDPKPWDFTHRDPKPNDVHISIDFCGICHSDIHQARDEWGGSIFPMVPGHEIVGTVKAIGSAVTGFKVGDCAAVGVMVDSCRTCPSCTEGDQQYCTNPSMTPTYNGIDRQGQPTYGGYATDIVVDEAYVLHVPASLDPPATAPLLCAGITTYSPLRHWNVGPGKKVGIVGLGGLGHMGLKFSHAFGAHTVLFTTSANKIDDAKRLGADEVILTRQEGWADKDRGTFDFLLDCVAAEHDINPYLQLLKRDGVLCSVGLPDKPFAVQAFSFLARRHLTGSMIGGIRETQEMLDFCAEHGIVSDIEMTTFANLSEAWTRVVKADVKYRFVLDCSELRK